MGNNRMGSWTAEKLAALSTDEFIAAFVSATEQRTDLKIGELTVENKIKNGAPPESIELCLKEAERRKIPLAVIAEKLVQRAVTGKSFISNLMAPSSWKDYEIRAANAIVLWVQKEDFKLDHVDFDARIIGKVTGIARQVDLWLQAGHPAHAVAVECKDYASGLVGVEKIEAFQTKLADIAANKGVYVTRSGYQRSAKTTADHYDIHLLIFDIVDKENPPADLSDQQKQELRASMSDFWCLRHKESSVYFEDKQLARTI